MRYDRREGEGAREVSSSRTSGRLVQLSRFLVAPNSEMMTVRLSKSSITVKESVVKQIPSKAGGGDVRKSRGLFLFFIPINQNMRSDWGGVRQGRLLVKGGGVN